MFLAQCSQGCTHGNCTSPNVCICTAGWTGTSCATGNMTLIQQKYEILTCVFKYRMAAEHWPGMEPSTLVLVLKYYKYSYESTCTYI